MKVINVAAGVVRRDGLILCARRSPEMPLPGLWEFPGGKLEPGEDAPAALARELREELSIGVEVDDLLITVEHEYDFGLVRLHAFECRLVDGVPAALEHDLLVWLPPEKLDSLEWAPADVPVVRLMKGAST